MVVYDAALTASLPVPMSVASGLNALAHCVDSMWAPRTDPIDQALAAEGIRALRLGLPAVVSDPTGLGGREQTLYGAAAAILPAVPSDNPTPVTTENLERLLHAAWNGADPR